jgi:hypothetical protein
MVPNPDRLGRISVVSDLFRFPNPVNEHAARLVAAGAMAMSVVYLATGWLPVLAVLAYGFSARVLTGPTLSPLGQLVTRVIVPALGRPPAYVPGPPKRFAQGIGATLSVVALVAHLAGVTPLAAVLVGAIVVAATLEAVLGFCLGCQVFALLMRAGIVPEKVCLECADISRRIAQPLDAAA